MNLSQKERCCTVLRFLFDEVMSACGDGDAWWYLKYHKVSEIEEVCDEFIKTDKWLKDWVKVKNEHELSYADNQEFLVIIDSKEEFDKIPSWAQSIYIG